MTEGEPVRVRVWDIPTRLVHWLIVVLVAVSWWTADTRRMDWHVYSGYGVFALVTFRLYWGLVGSSTARFRRFLSGPRTVVEYLRGRWIPTPGHNPLGALSVIALLALLLLQVAFGLFAVDIDGIDSGPLSTYVSFETGRVFAKLHDKVFDVLLILIYVHIAAVLYYVFVKRQNLIAAMVHGKRKYPVTPAESVTFGSVPRLVIGVVIASALTWIVASAFQFG